MSMPDSNHHLLDIQDLRVWYQTVNGYAKVVDAVSLQIFRNEILGIAGESGCGKSTTVEGILRLIKPPGTIASGTAHLYSDNLSDPVDLLRISNEEMRRLRWRHIAYVPQGAMNALNPVMRIETQIIDAILEHTNMTHRQAREQVRQLLEMVGLPVETAQMYPHELSGGMKQRVTIAAATALNPELLVADEPTTALDVTVQRVILQTLLTIRRNLDLTIVYVSHDMAIHAELADRMAIMYAGAVVEVAGTIEIFKHPLHPYTAGLIASIPDVGGERRRIEGIPGRAPSPTEWPDGCRFHPRCPHVMEICTQQTPAMQEVEPGRYVACFLHVQHPIAFEDPISMPVSAGRPT